jgi:hypothetical protein
VNKWRGYQRELFNYQKAKKRIEGEQRRAEWEKRRSEMDEPIDADVPSDDPLIGHPWADEILQCTDLEKVMALLMPSEATVPAPTAAPAVAAPEKGMFVGGKGASEEEDPFGALVKKPKGAKKAAAAPRPEAKTLHLTMDTIANLGNIGVEIPKTQAELAATLTKIKERKKAFEGMTEEDKKKQKSAKKDAGKAKDKEAKKEDKEKSDKDKTEDLVSVGITAKGGDGVQVKIDYPPLSASA